MNFESYLRTALQDRYEIISVIGKGGMATVFKAIQSSLNRVVALKVIHQELSGNREFLDRFLQEARVCASLNHPGIVTIYDFDSVGSINYIAMEYLDGLTLRELIKRKGKLTVNDTVKFITPVAEVLEYIHKKGHIHRDIKSSNIFVTKDRRVVLMDFGIVFSAEYERLSYAGEILGTPEYMSPEQAAGKETLDGRSDVYSLGVVLFECLTGRLPFQTNNPLSTLNQVIRDQPPLISTFNPDVPKWMVNVVSCCLKKDRNHRIQSGGLLSKILQSGQFLQPPGNERKQTGNKTTAGGRDTKNGEFKKKEKTRDPKIFLVYLIVIICIILVMIIMVITAPSYRTNYQGQKPVLYSLNHNTVQTSGSGSTNGPSTSSTVLTDIEGNKYRIVTIGTRDWMAENLKTMRYNDGTAIPLITDSLTWNNLQSPAFCWYRNNESNYRYVYGALYNWYAVNTGRLCPVGWHVPANNEWEALTNFLGGELHAARKLTEVGNSHWQNSKTGATNETGFSALPGGYRKISGFGGLGNAGEWWSSSPISSEDIEYAWYRFISSGSLQGNINADMKPYGMRRREGASVRCIKD